MTLTLRLLTKRRESTLPRVYTYYETLYRLMPDAVWITEMCEGEAVPGIVAGQVLPNPYQDEYGNHSPIGQVLCSMGVEVDYLERMATEHVRYCDETEDPDEPCVVCAEGADNSIYTQWVQDYLAEEYDISFTEEALDLLWSAETSGLTLSEWLELQSQR
jgi:hypothetical protein